MVQEHEDKLKKLTVVGSGYLRNALRHLDTLSITNDPYVLASFYIIRCSLDGIRERDFIRLISDLFAQYALPKKDYLKLKPEDIRRIFRKARERYTTSDNTGELGEIILFALLETERNAPQVLSKMALKTSGKIHVLGLDAIHIGVNNGEICRYYGESKTNSNHKDGIRNAVNDISKYHQKPARLEHEMYLISDHIDMSKFGSYAQDVLSFFDPYTRDQSKIRDVNAIFVGFDWDSICTLGQPNTEQRLEQAIRSKKDEICRVCDTKITQFSIKNKTEFFFIPFTSIDEARKAFQEEIA